MQSATASRILSFHKIKIIVDCSSVAIGVVLSFLFMHGLFGIREGTILSALLVGKLLPVVKKKISPVIQKLCFKSEKLQM